MTWTGCEETTWWLTWALRQEATQIRLADALTDNEPASQIIEHMIADIQPNVAGRVRAELSELPEATVFAMLAAWRQAFDGGKPFEVASARPAELMGTARRRSVRLVVDVNEAGVRAELSHIETRHPRWARSAADAIHLRRVGSSG